MSAAMSVSAIPAGTVCIAIQVSRILARTAETAIMSGADISSIVNQASVQVENTEGLLSVAIATVATIAVGFPHRATTAGLVEIVCVND